MSRQHRRGAGRTTNDVYGGYGTGIAPGKKTRSQARYGMMPGGRAAPVPRELTPADAAIRDRRAAERAEQFAAAICLSGPFGMGDSSDGDAGARDLPADASYMQPGATIPAEPRVPVASVQRIASGAAATADVQAEAARAVQGTGSRLPHLDQIQASFGGHDVTGVEAHVGGEAAEAAGAIGAEAFATGNHAAFASSPDVFTAAHEAAHVVQQRAGVQLKGGVG